MLEWVWLAVVVVLFIALPGWLLVNAAFPRRTWHGLQRFYLIVAGGTLTLMLVATFLGFIPHGDGRGWFTTMATGFPMVEISMIATCAGLYWVGRMRGAYTRAPAAVPTPAASAADKQ